MENEEFEIETESILSKDNLFQACRLCLSKEENNLLNAFSKQATNFHIIHKLNTYCNIIITEQDYLPKTICFSCFNEVNHFADFYSRIQENQKLLSKVLDFSNYDFEVNDAHIIKIGQELRSEDNSCDNDILEEDYYESEKEEEPIKDDSQICNTEEILSNLTENILNTENGEQNSENKSELEENVEAVDCFKPIIFKNGDEVSMKKWLKNTFKNIKNKEKIEKVLEECNTKSKFLMLPSYKSNYRICLDEPIREFFDLSCHHCNYVFLTFATMKKHMEEDHKEQCFLLCCNKKLYRREAIMEHISYHLNPKKFICHICEQVCKSKVTLKIHLKQHLPKDQRPFRCEKCEQSFVLNSQLRSHEKSHLSEDEKKYVCEECGKAFAFKFVLAKHIQHMHIREKNYMCEICARSFVDKVNLTAHKRTHDNSLPRLQCPCCDALLKNRVTLKVHMRTHNPGPEEHSCNKCHKILSTKNALMNHMQYVHGGKQYICTVCQKIFKKALTLKEHMTRHTGEILYNCQYCEKTFTAKSNKYSHVKRLHPKEWADQRKLKWGTVRNQP